jgi:hypothetical protein
MTRNKVEPERALDRMKAMGGLRAAGLGWAGGTGNGTEGGGTGGAAAAPVGSSTSAALA